MKSVHSADQRGRACPGRYPAVPFGAACGALAIPINIRLGLKNEPRGIPGLAASQPIEHNNSMSESQAVVL